LRQVLGALQAPETRENIYSGAIGDDWQSAKYEIASDSDVSLQFTTPRVKTGKLSVELYSTTGEKLRIKLVKSERIDPALQSNVWRLSLAALPFKVVNRIKFKLDQTVAGAEIALLN